MLKIIRTDSNNPDFATLVRSLDLYLAEKDGQDHAFYNQYNQIDSIGQVVLAYDKGLPVGCGAIKPYHESSMEIKRMYTVPESRGRGVATTILSELERWASEQGWRSLILETGKRQPEAIALYQKRGIPADPQLRSVCRSGEQLVFRKEIEFVMTGLWETYPGI